MYRSPNNNSAKVEFGRLSDPLKSRDAERTERGSPGMRQSARRVGFAHARLRNESEESVARDLFRSPRDKKIGRADNSATIHVEQVDSKSRFLPGDIVAFEFVSETKEWKWSIGTILRVGGNRGNDDGASGAEGNLFSLSCWGIAADVNEDSISRASRSVSMDRDKKAIENIRERQKEIEMEKAALMEDAHMESIVSSESIANALREDLLNADKDHWAKLLQMRNPPPTVRLVVQALFALLRVELLAQTGEEEWECMLRFMRSDAFTTLLSDSSASRLDASLAEEIEKTYQKNPLFTFNKADAASHIAGLMQKWVTSELQLYKSCKAFEKIEARLGELDEEAVQKNLEIRWLDNSLDVGRGWEGGSSKAEVMRLVLQSLAELGRVMFLRSREVSVVVRSSIFCRICVTDTSPSPPASAVDIIILQPKSLTRMCDIAMRKLRRVTFGLSERLENNVVKGLLDPAHQMEILYGQSLERERLMLHELDSLYKKHVLHTAELMRILRGVRSTRKNFAPHDASNSALNLSMARNRVRELEEALGEKENELRNLQESHTQLMNRLQRQIKMNADANKSLGSSQEIVLRMHVIHLEHSEEVTRMRLAADEMQQWSFLLLHELRESKDYALSGVNQWYLQELQSVQQKLSILGSRHAKAIPIMEESLRKMDGVRANPRANESLKGTADVERAIAVLKGLDTDSSSIGSSETHLTADHVQPGSSAAAERLPFRSSAAGWVGKETGTSFSMEEVVEEENVTILRERLLEAIQDRAALQDMLSSEQEKNRLLERQQRMLHTNLERETQERMVLDNMLRRLQGDVNTVTSAAQSSPDVERGKRSTGKRLEERHHSQEQQHQEVIKKLQSIIQTYEKELADVLLEEGVDRHGVSFASLRKCLERLKASCAAMKAERDLQASDAKMLESCLKTAADALDNALLHDERWQPRTTESNHKTWHWKAFSGDDWGRVIAETPEALSRALVHDIAFACHLPEEYVLDLVYREETTELHVSFDLRHDPSISAEEIIRRLNECNFHEMEKLYAHRFAPKEGIDILKQELIAKNNEVDRLQAVIKGLSKDSMPLRRSTSRASVSGK